MIMAKIKLTKSLYVGLGGTGIAAIIRTKKCFIDTYGEVPPMIGFLGIDTSTEATSVHVTSNNGVLIKLDASELLVITVNSAAMIYSTNKQNFNWFPPKNTITLDGISGLGAGQVRSNGRFIARYNYNTIKNKIESRIDEISRDISHTSRYTVDLNDKHIEFTSNIHVVGSIAGGTGSGMLIDIMAILKDVTVAKSFKNQIIPWIVMPEIFRTIARSSMMANVNYNAFGALKELDYLMHLDQNQQPIDFGYTTIKDSPASFAFLINNTASSGVVYDQISDLYDIIGRSMFLPANETGDKINGPMDNIGQGRTVGTYNIQNKRGWAASIGSAELIYDNNLVASSMCDQLVSYIAQSLNSCADDGGENANLFFDHSDVLIRENNQRDDVIDFLLPNPSPSYALNIDLFLTASDVDNYINDCTGQRVVNNIQIQFNNLLKRVNNHLEVWVNNLLNNDGGVCLAKNFLQSLEYLAGICKAEMIEESKKLQDSIYEINWSNQLSTIKNTGIQALINRQNLEQSEVVANLLRQRISDALEILRRDWAVKFYNQFQQSVIEKRNEVIALENKLVNISKERSQVLLESQQKANSASKFQVYLHTSDVMNLPRKSANSSLVANFVEFMRNNSGIHSFLGMSEKLIMGQIWKFANSNLDVQQVLTNSIEDVLATMPTDQVKLYLSRLKDLASPLWTVNTQGYRTQGMDLDTHIILGVHDQSNSLISNNEQYKGMFDTASNKSVLASTHQKDRITLLIMQNLLPVYAVNNFSTYKKETEELSKRPNYIANYLDEKWMSRMNSEGFRVTPKIDVDDSLQYWVYGFIFGYIHYDGLKNEYYTESKLGKPTERYRYRLGTLRNEAFDVFKMNSIHKELKEKLDKLIAQSGYTQIENKLKRIQTEQSYFDDFSQMSESERNQLELEPFIIIKNLIYSEIDFVQNLSL